MATFFAAKGLLSYLPTCIIGNKKTKEQKPNDDFNERPLCVAGHDRHCREPARRLHPPKRNCRSAGNFGKIPGGHRQKSGQSALSDRPAGQVRRLPPDQNARGIHGGEYFTPDRREPGPGGVFRTEPGGVPPHGGMPHPAHVAQAEHDDQRIPGAWV